MKGSGGVGPEQSWGGARTKSVPALNNTSKAKLNLTGIKPMWNKPRAKKDHTQKVSKVAHDDVQRNEH